jgi:hypothetical protein
MHDVARTAAVLQEVARERLRQIERGFTTQHDDQHTYGELADAAACYALNQGCETYCPAPRTWPWSLTFWKPKTRRTDLLRATAMLVAEIERLDRAQDRADKPDR